MFKHAKNNTQNKLRVGATLFAGVFSLVAIGFPFGAPKAEALSLTRIRWASYPKVSGCRRFATSGPYGDLYKLQIYVDRGFDLRRNWVEVRLFTPGYQLVGGYETTTWFDSVAEVIVPYASMAADHRIMVNINGWNGPYPITETIVSNFRVSYLTTC